MKVETSPEKKIKIKQAEWDQALALRAHLGAVINTVYRKTDEGLVGKQPLEIDAGQILLAAASLRALIFDDTGDPLLSTFLRRHNLDLSVNSFEGDFAMLLYAQMKPAQNGHLAHFLLALIASKEEQKQFPEGESKSFVLAAQDDIPLSLKNRTDVWRPRKDFQHSTAGLANDDHMVQLCHVTRRHVAVESWGELRMGFLKDKPIRRKSIIEYTANRLGGVHYDNAHHTKDPERQNEFRLLTQAYNWEHQAIMHGAVVATAICAIELASSPMLVDIYFQLALVGEKRRERLLAGKPLPEREQS